MHVFPFAPFFCSITAPIRGKVLTAEELEASLMGGDSKQTDQHVGHNDIKLQQHGLCSTPDGVHTSLPLAAMPSFGKVKTVSELEAGLKQVGLGKDLPASVAVTATNKQLGIDAFLSNKEQTHNDMAPTSAASDMNAFNKLLGMMKASGVLQEHPKMPVSTLSHIFLNPTLWTCMFYVKVC